MKLFTTKKQIKQNYDNIISISYCDAQHLLNYITPFAYSASSNSWSCDYYDIINGVIISTGYSPIGKRAEYKLTKLYDNAAKNKTPDERLKLLKEFINKVLEA